MKLSTQIKNINFKWCVKTAVMVIVRGSIYTCLMFACFALIFSLQVIRAGITTLQNSFDADRIVYEKPAIVKV